MIPRLTLKAMLTRAGVNSLKNLGKAIILFTLSVHFGNRSVFEFAQAAEDALPFQLRSHYSEKQISFWSKIYQDVSVESGFLHDSEDVSIIYEWAKETSPKIIDASKKRIQSHLLSIALELDRNKEIMIEDFASKDDARIFEQVGWIRDPIWYRKAAKRIRFQRGMKEEVTKAWLRGAPAIERMQEILKEENVPPELLTLVFVESAFNPMATSKVGAKGIWQFMSKTAEKHLMLTRDIDERRDPLKSTRAAAKYLASLKRRLKTWDFALIGFHQGEGLVEKGVKATKAGHPEDLVLKFQHPSYGFASRNYWYSCAAMWDVLNRLRQKNDLPLRKWVPFLSVTFPKPIFLKDLLKKFSIQPESFHQVNPQFLDRIRNSSVPIPAYYPVRLPGITLEEFRRLQVL